MAYTDDPSNSMTDRVRLKVGDIDSECEELSDSVYQYLLDTYSNNEIKAALEALKAILAKYARYANEKAGKLEIDYQSRYRSYEAMYKQLSRDNTFINVGTPFAGGINLAEANANRQSTTKTNTTLYEGFTTDESYVVDEYI